MRRSLITIGSMLFALTHLGALQARQQARALTPTEVFEKNRAAVVTIETSSSFGSGVLLEASGVVVTNLHVIAGVESLSINLANGDAYDDVAVIEVDERRDLVLLKLKGFKLSVAELGDSNAVEVGDPVYAIGAPRGLELSISEGIVSAIRDTGAGFRVIQTTAAISQGSSGGGLFDRQGRLVGVTSFTMQDGENITFAVPVNYLRGILSTTPTLTLAQLARRTEKKPAAPVAESPATAASSSQTGAVVPASMAPKLADAYRSTAGPTAFLTQDGDKLMVRLLNTAGVYAQLELMWNSSSGGFVGQGMLQLDTCGTSTDKWSVPISAEMYPVTGGYLRNRWTHPERVNCRQRRVLESSWREAMWQAIDR